MRFLKKNFICLDPTSKYDIGFNDWPWKLYPQFVWGPAYLLSHEAIVPILAAIQTTPMIPFEDVYLSGICAEKAKVETKNPYVDQNSL